MTNFEGGGVSACRACGGSDLHPFLDLGAMPPANAFLRREDLQTVEARFPLALCLCVGCGLIQLTHVVTASALFTRYAYFSSVSDDMIRHFAALAHDVTERFAQPDALVVEIGSNDGVLLRSLLGKRLRVLGVDPAENVAAKARVAGVPTLAAFFSRSVAERIRDEHGHASVILANNVLAHIDDLEDAILGIGALLAPRGVFVLEVPYVVDFIENLEFDTVYHEHLSYFGVGPLCHVFGRFGMEVFEVSHRQVHGGTIRVMVRRKGGDAQPPDPSVAAFVAREKAASVRDEGRLAKFARDVVALRRSLLETVEGLRASGKRVVGYSAPAKGIVLLNYCGLGADKIEYLADATEAKQGLYAPGVRIPVVDPEHFRRDRPDAALLLAWNHAEEIKAKERAWRDGGGRFIVAIPRVQVL